MVEEIIKLILVKECSSDSKESGSSEEDDEIVNQASGHVGLRKCCCMSSDRTLALKAVVEPDIHGDEDFFNKTAKNVGVNIVSQSKDNHELEKLF